MLDYFKIAFVNLRHRKLRSWLTLLGILIGIGAVVALIGLGDGLRLAIISQFGISSTEVLSVQAGGITGAGPPGTGVVNKLTNDDLEEIERLGNVENAVARLLHGGKIEFNDRVGFGMAVNVAEGDDRKLVYEIIDIGTADGRLLKDGDVGKVMLGYNFFANKVGLEKPVKAGDTVLLQDKKFEVVGITSKKGSFILDNVVYMQDDDMKDLYPDIGENIDIIGVKVKDKDIVNDAKEDIEKLLRKRRDVKEGEEDFTVETPQAALSSINSILIGIQVFVAIIAGISIVVGGLGIINTMLTAVLERRSQIGIMKAVGAKNSDIFFMFFIESGMMGFVGGVIGVTIGTAISYFGTIGINSFIGADILPQINLTLIISALFGSFVIGSVSGIAPALRAAKQNPVDAIRG